MGGALRSNVERKSLDGGDEDGIGAPKRDIKQRQRKRSVCWALRPTAGKTHALLLSLVRMCVRECQFEEFNFRQPEQESE